jgi:hypothetical protein
MWDSDIPMLSLSPPVREERVSNRVQAEQALLSLFFTEEPIPWNSNKIKEALVS